MYDTQSVAGTSELPQAAKLTQSDKIAIANAKDHACEYGIKVHYGDAEYEQHLVVRYWWTQNCDKLTPVNASTTTFESSDLAWLAVAHFWFNGPSLPVTSVSAMTIQDADRLLGLADQFMDDWENDTPNDPDLLERKSEYAIARKLFVVAPMMYRILKALAEYNCSATLARGVVQLESGESHDISEIVRKVDII